MRTKNIIVSVCIIIGIVGLGAFFWYQNTLNIAERERAGAASRQIDNDETLASGEQTTVSQGEFIRLDPAHEGKGSARIIQAENDYVLELGDDFEVSDGPDLYVWLVKEQDLGGAINGVDTDPSTYLDLGPLNNFSGLQKFSITEEEANEFNYAVVIWCRAFSVHFTNAVLESV